MRTHTQRTLPAAGFTMIELILVMVLLTAAVAFSAPRLAAFFRGRALDSEARRLLALTRYAQERAASEGIPVRMWFDVRAGTYGVEIDPSFVEGAQNTLEFKVPDGMQLVARSVNAGHESRQVVREGATTKQDPRQNLPAIRFVPEGGIDFDSLSEVTLTDRDGFSLMLTPAKSRMHYEIQGGAGK